MSNIYLGCAIWGYRRWIGSFLPANTAPGDLLRAYSARLTTVEVNSTFYALPDAPTIARWTSETPETFHFCPKVPRAISHAGRMANSERDTHAFIERIAGFGSRLGPVFLQLPPGYGPALLADLLGWLDRWPHDLRLAVEARHPGWFEPASATRLNAELQQRTIGRVLVDVRPINTGTTADPIILEARRKKPAVPLQPELTAPWTLVRFMGHPALELDQPLISEWAERLAGWVQAGTLAYVFMHCPVEEQSPTLCHMLAEQLQAQGLPAPLPAAPQPPRQTSLFDL